MLSGINPLAMLAAGLAWLVVAILVFDPVFQLATIAWPSGPSASSAASTSAVSASLVSPPPEIT